MLALLLAAPLTIALPEPTRVVLDDGLRVIVMEDHSTPVVAVQMWFHVGSKDDAPDAKGMAHLFEHLMFRGTAKYGPGKFDELLDGVGAHNNAETGEDTTAFVEQLPADQLDLALMLEADRMRNLAFDPKTFDPERKVVEEEHRQTWDDDPTARAYEAFRELAFTTSPYRWTPIGTIEDLEKITIADAKAFYDRFYQPNDAVLVVVGDEKTDEVIAKAKKWFAAVPRGKDPAPALPAEPPQTSERRRTVTLVTQLPLVFGGFHVPGPTSPDRAPLEVLSRILSAGQSSRMYRHLVKEKQLAVFAGGESDPMEDGGLFLVSAGLSPDAKPDAAAAALLGELDAVAKDGVTAHELEKAKNDLTSSHVFGLDTVEGKASSLGEAELLEGGYRAFLDEVNEYQAVTADQVQAVAKKYLVRSNLTLLTVTPAEEK